MAIPNNLAQVIDVSSIGQHIRNLKALPTLSLRIAGHDHGDFSASQIVRPRLPVPNTFDSASRIAEWNKLLQQFRIAMLDVIQIQHHVVAHLQPEIDSLNFLASRGVRGFGRI